MKAILRKIKKVLKALTITNLKAVLRYIKHNGFKGLYTTCINKIRFGAIILDEYETWRANNEPTSEELEKQKSYISCQNISFELVYKEENSLLEDSIQALTYTNFKKTKVENNDFLNIIQNSTSDYIVFIGKNIGLAPFSLYELVRSIEYRDSIMLYSDNDTIIDGKRTKPNFKPDFAKDTLRSENYIGNFLVVKTKFLKIHSDILKNLNKNFVYDIAFRVSEKTRRIEHIPKILFNNLLEEMEYDTEDEKKIIAEHLQRCNTPFDKIEDGRYKGQYKIQYTIIGNPKISIVIPNKDHIADLEKAVQSIIENSTYKNYEIVIVENNSTEKETFSYYEKIQKEYPETIKVVKFEIDYFNYSATVNFGVENANRRICNIIK